MSYEALVTRVANVRLHPNADRIKLATVSGFQVVVGFDQIDGELGIFFPSDGRLSHEFLHNNNLYKHAEKNKDVSAKPGFFDDNGRVRAQRFRGELSDGFWIPMSALSWTGEVSLIDGDTFTVVNGFKICEKYISPQTSRAMSGRNNPKKKTKIRFPQFAEHYDIKQLRMNIGKIPIGSTIVISCKLHGTSGRTGHLLRASRMGWFHRLRLKIARLLGGRVVPEDDWAYVSGTRKVVLHETSVEEDGFYSGKRFRNDVHQKIKSGGLRKGETVYYEIVGYAGDNSLIMPAHEVEDKDLKKIYGDKMIYAYGCTPGTFKIFVYRITMTNSDGTIFEYPYYTMVKRCQHLGLNVVPTLLGPTQLQSKQELIEWCDNLSKGPSTIDPTHIREGVCVRVEHPDMETIFKWKNTDFCILEGIKKNDPSFIDPEDLA